MSTETGQNLSEMEQTVASISASSATSLVSSSSSPPAALTSSSTSPGKDSQVVSHFPSAILFPQSTSSSSSPSLQKLSSPLKSPQTQTTRRNRSVLSSLPYISCSISSSFSSSSSSSFASSTSASSSLPNAMSISTTSCVSGGPVAEMLSEAKASQEIDRNLNRCDPVMASSNASLSSAAAVAMTVAASAATTISTEPQNVLGDPTQIHQLSQGMVAMPANFNTSPTAITNVSPLTVQQNNIVVSHQQQFQQAVAAGLNHQTAAGCFNVQLGSDQSSSQAHGALQQTTTMQGVLQQTVVVSDNVAVQQRVAVAQETVSQQIVHPVSSTNAVAQVTGVEQQQHAQQQQAQQQQQQQQTGGFQLHQANTSNLPAQQTFQLTNLGQSLISPQNFSSLVAQPGTIFNGAQIFCAPDLTRTQQIDVSAMGCQQFLASPSNTFTGGHVVSGVPQVQLVQTGPNQFIQQQCLQQQFMFQSVPALQNNGVTIQQQHTTQQHQQQQANIAGFQQQTQQTDATTKNQAILPATSQQQQSQQQQNISCLQQSQQQNTPQQNVSMIRFTVSGSYGIPQQQQQTLSVKGLATVLPQQNNMGMCNNNNNMNQKQLLQKQQPQQGQLLFGTIGMLPNQTLQQAPQQQTIYQQQRPLSLGTMNHQAAQITIGNNGALRFAGPSFITNTGQLLSSNPTVLNLGQIQVPIMNQQLLVAPQQGGTTTLLGSQPLYIRTADPFSNQQGVVGNVPIQQVKNIANIAPQTATVINQVTPQPRRGGDKSGGGASGGQQTSGKSGHKSVSNKLQSIAKSTSSTPSSAVTSSNHSSSSVQTSVAHQHTAASLALSLTSSHTITTPAKLTQSSMPTNDPSSVTVQDLSVTGRPPPVIVVQPKQQLQSDEKRGVEKTNADGSADLGKHQQSFATNDKNVQLISTAAATAFPQGGPVSDNFNHDEANNLNFHLLSTTKEEEGDEQRLVIIEEPSNQLGSLAVKTVVTTASAKRQDKKMKKKRNAKPKVLTHIIEGFIIQEATEPFPVNRISLANQFLTSSLRSSSSESLATSNKESPTGGNKHDSEKMEDSSTEEEENNEEDDDDDETEDESQPSSKRPRLDEPVKNIIATASNVVTPSSNSVTPSSNGNVINASSNVVIAMNAGQEAVCMSTVPTQLTAINLSSTHQQQAAQLMPTVNKQILSHVQPSPQQLLQQTQFHPQPKQAAANKVNQDRSSVSHLTCEFCGKTDLAENFPCSKRFCSVSCSKRFSAYSHRYKQVTDSGNDSSTTVDVKPLSMMSVVKGSKRPLGQPKTQQQFLNSERGPNTATVAASIHIPATASSTTPSINNMLLTTANQQQQQQFDHTLLPQQHLSYSTPTTAVTPNKQQLQQQQPSSISPAKQHLSGTSSNEDLAGVVCPDKPLSQWSVNDVYNFVGSLPGCATYAQEFRQQEIDGPALGLLKEDHLMTTLNVKLGPALKICAVVNSLKTD